MMIKKFRQFLNENAPFARGRAKEVYDHPTDPSKVKVRIARPSSLDTAFVEFCRHSHANRTKHAKHLPKISKLENKDDGSLEYETERLDHQTGKKKVSLGLDRSSSEDGGWYTRGLDPMHPSHDGLRKAMHAAHSYIRSKHPDLKFYGDAHPDNIMMRGKDHVLNDPFEIQK